MNLYTHDLSFLDFSFYDPNFDPLYRTSRVSSSADSIPTVDDPPSLNRNPSIHRHDGSSPLPLGMDWSSPPRNWVRWLCEGSDLQNKNGRNTLWPHDPHTGWSYCVTVPSWVILPKSRGSEHVVFYRVQIGIQTPEGITSTRGILRRFSDFLKLYSDLKNTLPKKVLPSAPPKRLLNMKSHKLVEERRCLLEDWMEKLLSDIDISRSAVVATFLELEAAARSSFHDAYQTSPVTNSSPSGMASSPFQPNSDVFVVGSSSVASDYGDDFSYEISEFGTPRHGRDLYSEQVNENFTRDLSFTNLIKNTVKYGISNWNLRPQLNGEEENMVTVRDEITEYTASHVRRLSNESAATDLSSVRNSEILNLRTANSLGNGSLHFPDPGEALVDNNSSVSLGLQFPRNLVVAFPSDERDKFNRVFITMQRRLATAKTDMEDLIARLNQEIAVRQYLTTKVKDLEVELETTNLNSKENIQQTVLNERERFTQMQWDMEELKSKCLEMELKVKSAQDEKVHTEATKNSVLKENEMLMRQLDVAREQVGNLQNRSDDLELKSKADVKLLVKEVKSLRSSQSELKQELSQLMKEKIEVERLLQKEKRKVEQANTANAKLLHESEILCSRLEECSVNFLIEEEDKLVVDAPSSSDAIDTLTMSDNRIGLLLAEAQLLAQDVENAAASVDRTHNNNGVDMRTAEDQLRKMLTDILVQNATLRKQVNSIIRCALTSPENSGKDDEEGASLRKTALSKFLER